MSDELVLRDVHDGVAVLTLNRPDRLNAWTHALETRYFDLLEDCAADQSIGSGGIDGQELPERRPQTAPRLRSP